MLIILTWQFSSSALNIITVFITFTQYTTLHWNALHFYTFTLPFQSLHHGLHIMGNGSDVLLYQRARKFASLHLCIRSQHITIL